MNRRRRTQPRWGGNRKARQSRKSPRRWLLLLVVWSSLGGIGFLAYHQVPTALAGMIAIQEVAVSGIDHVSRGEVTALLELSPEDTLLSVDADELRSRVEGHPWIAEAHIGRMLPHTLTVLVTEREPAALFKHAGGELVLDKEGVVLSIASGKGYPHLPVISGVNVVKLLEGHTEQRERIKDGIRAARLVGEQDVSDLRVVLGRSPYFEVVTERTTYQFSQDPELSWQHYLALRPTILTGASGKRHEIDLRYAGKVIVR